MKVKWYKAGWQVILYLGRLTSTVWQKNTIACNL